MNNGSFVGGKIVDAIGRSFYPVYLEGLTKQSVIYLALACDQLDPSFIVDQELNKIKIMVLVGEKTILNRTSGGNIIDKLNSVGKKIVKVLNEMRSVEFQFGSLRSLEQIHVINEAYQGKITTKPLPKPIPAIRCLTCYNFKVQYYNPSKQCFSCAYCYETLDIDNKVKWRKPTVDDFEKHSLAPSLPNAEKVFQENVPIVIIDQLNKSLGYLYDIAGFCIHSNENVQRMDLHVINIFKHFQNKKIASQTVNLFYQYGIINNKDIYLTMSNCLNSNQFKLYAKYCRSTLFLPNDMVGIYDDVSHPMQIVHECVHWDGFNKEVGFHLNIFLQRYRLFLRFQQPEGLCSLSPSVLNFMQMIDEDYLLNLCLKVLAEGVEKSDIVQYLDLMIHEDFKQSNEYPGKSVCCCKCLKCLFVILCCMYCCLCIVVYVFLNRFSSSSIGIF